MTEQVMSLETAEKVLGLGTSAYDISRILRSREILVECAVDNEEEHKIENYLEAADICVDHDVEDQLRKKGIFVIVAPWEDACPVCNGVGRRFKLDKMPVEVGCHTCDGSGKTKQKCPACEGTTRYLRDMGSLKINVRCKFCDDDGMSLSKCPDCRGKGTQKKMVNSGKIASSSICKHCSGMGHKPPVEEKPIFNDVMNRQLAKAIEEAYEV